jgi:pimeloyl-ACP methyl ester carboxylesterase
MPHIDRDGVQVFFEEGGSGPAVLLSHGYGATSCMWRGQVDALSPRYRVLTWDMRGHGDSASPDAAALYSEAATVDDMAAILDSCGISRAVVGGLSLGGYMSLAFYVKYPERVEALMLFDTGPGYRKAEARAGWNQMAERRARALEEQGLDALRDSGEEVRASRHRSAAGLAHAARGMLAQFDARVIDALPSIAVPALVLVGERDEPFIVATEVMSAKIPRATKVVIPGAGHAANLHQPAAFNRAVEEFLGTLGRW